MEDTEWNDILRQKGIIPEKEITEEEIVEMVEQTVQERLHGKPLEDRTLDELDELEDEEDERVLLEYRQKRIQELQQMAQKQKYGEVRQISKPDYQEHVTEASKDVWVVVHLFQDSLQTCKLVNSYLDRLSKKHKHIKFLKIVATQCIPNYPDRNCPTLLIYGEGEMRAQLVGYDRMRSARAIEEILYSFKAIDKLDREEDGSEDSDGTLSDS